MDVRSGAAVEETRCPSCARLLVLRSGPQVAPHFAHRPRQSCRRRPGRVRATSLRLEQLTLFDVEPLAPPPVPVFYFRPRPVPAQPPGRAPARRRRRAWLPRLLSWLRARATSG